MVSMRTVILLALSAKALGADVIVPVTGAAGAADAAATAATAAAATAAAATAPAPAPASAPIVVPPKDVLCPSMIALPIGTQLKTEPYTFGRIVHIVKESATPGGKDTELGTVTAKLLTWNTEFEVKDPINHKLIAKIVHPAFFWQTTQDVFDCSGVHIGSVGWDFNFLNWFKSTFLGYYHTHKVMNAAGTPVAQLSDEELTQKKGFFASQQHYVFLKDLLGAPLASMRNPSGGWNVGPFGERLNVQVLMESNNGLARKPSMDPEFLSLIFASALDGGSRFGPLTNFVIILVVLFFVMFSFCGGVLAGGKAEGEKSGAKNAEEGEGLLGTRVAEAKEEVKVEGRGGWACCSRRGVAPK